MLMQVAALMISLAAMTQADDSLTHERLEKMLAEGDTALIVQVFRRYDDEALSFIDEYFEGGLKIIEEGGDAAKARASFQTGLALAKLADEAMPGAVFAEYAASFASWSPKEQKLFREGQNAYRDGRKALETDAAAAKGHFERSLSIAESLNDHWGAAMASTGLVSAYGKLNDLSAVSNHARKASDLNAKLRLRVALIKVNIAWGDAEAAADTRNKGNSQYNYALNLLRPDDDPKLRQEIVLKYADALEKVGQKDMAEKLRAGKDPTVSN